MQTFYQDYTTERPGYTDLLLCASRLARASIFDTFLLSKTANLVVSLLLFLVDTGVGDGDLSGVSGCKLGGESRTRTTGSEKMMKLEEEKYENDQGNQSNMFLGTHEV